MLDNTKISRQLQTVAMRGVSCFILLNDSTVTFVTLVVEYSILALVFHCNSIITVKGGKIKGVLFSKYSGSTWSEMCTFS